jgi:hypothetical protein
MNFLSTFFAPAARRAHRAYEFAAPAHALRMGASAEMPALPAWVEDEIFNMYVGSPDLAIAVTEEGFITMALLRSAAVVLESGVAIPGYDSEGSYGYMVFQRGERAFQSRASTARLAIVDARQAQKKALALQAHFGHHASLKLAAERAPWFAWATLADARAAGLCEWGCETFLRRHGLWSLASLAGGLPKCLLWFSGGYGQRVMAAAAMRREKSAPASTSTSLGDALDGTMAKLMLRNRAELEHHSHAL